MNFTYDYYAQIIEQALDSGYRIVTVSDFVSGRFKNEKVMILRHDLDKNPHSMYPMAEVEMKLGVKSSIFVRVMGAEYNPLSYHVVTILKKLESEGFEIGLHSNFLEFATFTELDPISVLRTEYEILASIYKIKGISCHRDINFSINSLPFLQDNWASIQRETGLKYDAYDENIFGSLEYVNEGLNPHLNWRNRPPTDPISEGKSLYLLTHNHWWFESIPFLS